MAATFITGTGTEVGKTFVAAALIRSLRAAGRPVEALKPVVTGFDPITTEASDPGLLLAALGRPVTLPEIERIAPWRYATPVAPDLAARRERRPPLDFDALVAFSRKAIAAHQGTLLIEGVGGIMVPLTEKHTVLDWMVALEIPLVVVTGTYLGTLSHTLTCLDVLARRNLSIRTLIVNDTPGSPVTMHSTTESLSNFVQGIPIASMRRIPDGVHSEGVFGAIAELL